MGKAYSALKNPFKNFNLESRAHKVISQSKPKPAPKHKREQEQYERMLEDYPEAYQESLKKNPELDKYLKDVFVVSQDSKCKDQVIHSTLLGETITAITLRGCPREGLWKACIKNKKENHHVLGYADDLVILSQDQFNVENTNVKQQPDPNRPLPSDRSQVQSFMYGIKEPDPDKIPIGKTTLGNVLEFISKYQQDPKMYNANKIAEDYVLQEATVRNILKYFRVFEVYLPQERRSTKAKFAGPSLPKIKIIKEIRKQLPEPKSNEKT